MTLSSTLLLLHRQFVDYPDRQYQAIDENTGQRDEYA